MISHKHKTIFVHVPKCAGQSIEKAFLADLGLDWSSRGPLLLRKNREPAVGPLRLAHLEASEYVKYHYLSEELFTQYYKFAVVRDPYARVVSLCNYLATYRKTTSNLWSWMPSRQRQPKNLSEAFETFILRWFEKKPLVRRDDGENWYWFVKPQVSYVFRDGELAVNDVFKLEDLKLAIPKIRCRAGLKSEIKRDNVSERVFSVASMDNTLKAVIREVYAEDFEKLGYSTASIAVQRSEHILGSR